VIALLLVGTAIAVTLLTDSNKQSALKPMSRGLLLEPPRARPDFVLVDQNGDSYDFGEETSGQLTFLFFGYTYCPDICPITMATLSAALNDSVGVGGRIVFVSTDPVRDTPERLQEWLKPFGSNVVGLTGTLEQVESAQRAAGTIVAVPEAPNAKGSYLVGHSSAVTVYTPDDLAHLQIGSGTTQAEWMQEIDLIHANAEWNRKTGIDVSDVVASDPIAGSGAVYLAISNNGEDEELVGVSTPVAAASSLHVTTGNSMSDVSGIALPKGQTTRLVPGGNHIMITGPLVELSVGDAFDLTLRFANRPPITVSAEVVTYDELAARIP
jgi:protein SCO1/2